MSKRKLEFMKLFVIGKIDFEIYNRIIIYLDMIKE